MKKLILFLSLVSPSAFAQDKNYDSYSDIVRDLSSQRARQVATEMTTTLPPERYHLSLGVSNSSTDVAINNIGSVQQNGLLIGAAMPLIASQLFIEGYGKFYKNNSSGGAVTGLSQYELRLAHKERLDFAILNLGVGASVRRIEVQTATAQDDVQTPNLMITAGLERRVTPRISLAGDLGYHRSLRDDPTGKNTVEFVFRLNYHL